MRAVVYLNEGPGRFINFAASMAQLRLAAVFELTADAPHANLAAKAELAGERHGVDGILSYIFEQLNVGGDMVPATDWTKAYRANQHRSLSVGDVVVLGETAWAVASLGFTKITTDELKGTIA